MMQWRGLIPACSQITAQRRRGKSLIIVVQPYLSLAAKVPSHLSLASDPLGRLLRGQFAQSRMGYQTIFILNIFAYLGVLLFACVWASLCFTWRVIVVVSHRRHLGGVIVLCCSVLAVVAPPM